MSMFGDPYTVFVSKKKMDVRQRSVRGDKVCAGSRRFIVVVVDVLVDDVLFGLT